MAVNLADVVTMATLEVNNTTLTTIAVPTDFSIPTMAVEVFTVALMAILIVFTFQGNLWIIITVMVTPQLRSCMTSIFVVNLCTIDLLASIVTMPLSAVTFLRGQDGLAKEMCPVNGFFSTFVMVSSTLSLAAVAVERYYSISLPMHYAGHATPCIYLILVTFIWSTSVVLSVLPLAGISSYSYNPAKRACDYTSQENTTSGGTFVILIFIISFLVPSLVMIIMYVNIFRVARKAAATVGPRPRCTNAVNSGNGIKTVHASARQSIFTISRHTAPTNTQTQISQSDVQRIVSVNNSEYSKRALSEENSMPTEINSIRPGELINSEPLKVAPENNFDSKLEETYHGKIWLHNHLHRGKAHCKFLCVCCRAEHAGDRPFNSSESHAQTPDPNFIPTTHTTEADIPTNPKDTSVEVSTGAGKVKASHIKALRTLMIIVVTHLILWGPYFVCQVYELAQGQTVSQVTEIIITWLSFLSYTANPCLYGLMNRTIREELGQMLKTACRWTCCCSCSQGGATWRHPRHSPPTDSENEEGGCGEGENFFQFLQRTQASDTTPPAKERNR